MGNTASALNDCTVAETALTYGAGGWPVFPVHGIKDGRCTCGDSGCSSPGKHPRVGGGFKAAITEPEQIRAWWAQWPNANIGIRTGAESGVVVLDLDRDPGRLEETLAQQGITWGKTPTSRTGGDGRHIYFRHPGMEVQSKACILTLPSLNGAKPPQVDIRGDGGYVIAPPSLHISGQRYEWEWDPPSVELAPLPTSLLHLIRGANLSLAPTAESWVSTALRGPVPEGTRNGTLTRLAGYLLADERLDPDEVIALLDPWARTVCTPPLDARELSKTVFSIARREQGKRVCDLLPLLPSPEFLTREFATKGNVIAGGNLPRGGKLVIVGPGGVGKSLLAISLGICLASGKAALGEIAIAAPQRVGLFPCEDPAGETQVRLRRQVDELRPDQPPDGLFVFTREEPLIFGGRHGRPQEEALARLTETVRRHALSVVIFDPLVALHEASENDNSEMARWLFRLGDTLQRESCAIILTHHVTWGQDGEPHSRGASVIQNWADTVWNLRRIEARGRMVVKLTLDKINFGPRWDPLILTLDPESLLFRAEGEQSALCPVPALLEYLRDEHGGAFRGKKGDLYRLVQAQFGCGERTVRAAFRAALSHQPSLLRDLGRGGGFEVVE